MSDKLEVLDQSRRDWRIRVRVTRMWPCIAKNGDLVGFNFIFLDAEVCFE